MMLPTPQGMVLQHSGYPTCDNNRTEEDQDFGDQYGILLNGNRWNIATTLVAVTTKANVNGTGNLSDLSSRCRRH